MTPTEPDRIYAIALGSNEDRAFEARVAMLLNAVHAIDGALGRVAAVSRIYRTPAFPPGSGPDFANAALCLHSDLKPEILLQRLHRIEADSGRARLRRWAQRSLDLDVLTCGQEILPSRQKLTSWMNLPETEQLSVAPDTMILPHPRLQDRPFVLVPMSEILPEWTHPITGKSVVEMVDDLAEAEILALHPTHSASRNGGNWVLDTL